MSDYSDKTSTEEKSHWVVYMREMIKLIVLSPYIKWRFYSSFTALSFMNKVFHGKQTLVRFHITLFTFVLPNLYFFFSTEMCDSIELAKIKIQSSLNKNTLFTLLVNY